MESEEGQDSEEGEEESSLDGADVEIGRMPDDPCEDEFHSTGEGRRRAQQEEQLFMERTAKRYAQRFSKLQSQFAKERAAWDRSKSREDAVRVQNSVALGISFAASPAQLAAAQRAGEHLAAALADVRDAYRERAEDVAVQARSAMRTATARWE